ncbi:LamG domain-containing protein [Micromonospora mirobrigensis]|nr:LamG domain-containing protein [Micromonospora mirobrigensis]
MSSLLVAPSPVEAAAPLSAPAAPAGPSVAPDAGSAAARAKRSGVRVEVASARTELTQVFANPSGGFTSESAVVPQRVRRADGAWADVDLNLRPGADGSLRPGVSVADVRFSAGGNGPAVTLLRQGKSLTLSWPGGLPKPTVSADSATYAEVLPGTDLVLRATRTGFTHVFAVKTPQAAANPALRTLRFDLGGDARVVRGADGRLSAVAGSDVLAAAEPAVMWDSASTPSATSARSLAASGADQGGGSPSRSSAVAPGDVARTAAVGVEVAGGDLVLRPDAKLLAGATAFPVFIDPAWSTGKTRWAYATNDNSNNSDLSVARVGRDPDSGKIYRSYFDFPVGALKSKHIQSAYVQMKLDHSWSCTDTPTYLFHTAGIASTPRTKWAPGLIGLKSSANSHANEGSGCSDSPQPDMTVNFTGSSVTSVIQSHATNGWSNITLGFCACSATNGSGESTTDRWKKFFPNNAKLVVDFDNIPGAPTNLQAGGVACVSGQRIAIGSPTPTLSAIFRDADTTQALRTAYEWLQIPSTGTYNDATPRKTAPAGASVPANGRSTTAGLSGVVDGVSYAFRARATDPAPYSKTGAWSAWCEFTVDRKVPPVTVELSSANPRPLPGTVASFGFKTTDLTVTKFHYGWTSPTIEVPASRACVGVVGGGSVCYQVGGASVVVPKYGMNTLHVDAIDGAGNEGHGSVEFTADRPSPAVARWGLESFPGVTQAQALADSQPALAGDTPLTPSGTAWASDVRLVGGQTVDFNGATSYASTGAPVIDRSKSFSMAAWVKLGKQGDALPTDNRVIVSQEGDTTSSFTLGYLADGGRKKFAIWAHTVDANPTTAYATAVAPTSPTMGVWTHVAGAYDAAAGTFVLYVNGVQVASTALGLDGSLKPWPTARRISVGREWHYSAATTKYWQGQLADVQIFDRAVVPQDFTGQLKEDPTSGGFDEPGMLSSVQVGDWNFTGATPCWQESTDPTLCNAPEAGQFGRRLALTLGTDVGSDGRDFLSFDSHALADPSQATIEYGRSLRDVGGGNWQETPVLRTEDSFSVSVWMRPESLGSTQTAVAQAGAKQSAFYLGLRTKNISGTLENRWCFSLFGVDSTPLNGNAADAQSGLLNSDDLNHWTHLVGVYDRGRRESRLYVNGDLVAKLPFPTAFTGAFGATGPLFVGAARYTSTTTPQVVDLVQGDVGNLGLFQGALTDVEVKKINEKYAGDVVTPIE